MGPLQKFIESVFWRLISARARKISSFQTDGATIIFAPHPNDETLGCGGAISKLVQDGAELVVVFMSNGELSQANLAPKETISEMRRQEGIAATSNLGIPNSRIHFIGLTDGNIKDERERGTEDVLAILQTYNAKQVFVPYKFDANPDHEATREIVVGALDRWKQQCRVFEYGVWIWFNWPFAFLGTHNPYKVSKGFKAMFRILRDFNSSLVLGDSLRKKKMALELHRSQMEVLEDNWPVLADYDHGSLLKATLRDQEFFRLSVANKERS